MQRKINTHTTTQTQCLKISANQLRATRSRQGRCVQIARSSTCMKTCSRRVLMEPAVAVHHKAASARGVALIVARTNIHGSPVKRGSRF